MLIVTAGLYYDWQLRDIRQSDEEDLQRKKRASQITPEEVFKVAYEYNPFGLERNAEKLLL